MGDPGWSWPFWKFGLTRDDLFGALHTQYNTVTSSIQDPVAFHHDVLEVSTKASTTDEFHRLLADRKERRLQELNESLESASFEIIGNPQLIGTEQWQYAVQLFRTRSLDSLVRYFASYLPDNHPWHKPFDPSDATCIADSRSISYTPSISDSVSSADSISNSHGSIFDENDVDSPRMTEEPLAISTTFQKSHTGTDSRLTTLCSDSTEVSPTDHHVRCGLQRHQEKSHFPPELSFPALLDAHEPFELVEMVPCETKREGSSQDEEEEAPSQYPEDDFVLEQPTDVHASETPTPKPTERAVWVTAAEPSLEPQQHRQAQHGAHPSSPGLHPLSEMEPATELTHVYRDGRRLAKLRRPTRREFIPRRGRWRRTGGSDALRHKMVCETQRSRQRVHRRFAS